MQLYLPRLVVILAFKLTSMCPKYKAQVIISSAISWRPLAITLFSTNSAKRAYGEGY